MKNYSEKRGLSRRIQFPISVKLISIITALVIILISSITFIVSVAVSNDVRTTAESENFTANTRSASETENLLKNVRSSMFLLLNWLNTVPASSKQESVSVFFERNPDLAAIIVPDVLQFFNEAFFLSNDLQTDSIELFLNRSNDAIVRSRAGETLLVNAAAYFNMPILALFYPLTQSGPPQSAIVFFSTEKLTESFGTGANSSVLINYTGDLLVSADFEAVKLQQNIADWDIVKRMLSGTLPQEQIMFNGPDGTLFFGSYFKLNIFNSAVITCIPANIVFEGVRATTRRNVYLGGAILFLSIIFVFFFSKSISNPVQQLTRAAEQIRDGKYLLDIKPSTHDELGLLTESFIEMGIGLSEREKLKDAFGRFTNKDIVERASKGELKLGGETKNVSIFFSDIRSFTEVSERLSPSETVAFLNEYMTRMVNCVTKNNGVVDKFIGDAIMGVWGAPLSSGTVASDALNSVRSALHMRYSLYKYNVERKAAGKDPVQIGIGINSGAVVAGQIGTNERMEYTVIGDAVNLASRIESLNKPFCTDILISENTLKLVSGFVQVEEMPPVTIKGKGKIIRIYAVIHMDGFDAIFKDKNQIPKTLSDVRKIIGMPEPDLGRINVNAEEKKYRIHTD